MSDFEIDEVRRIRHQISAEHDHDLNKQVEYYRRLEEELLKSGRFQPTARNTQMPVAQPVDSVLPTVVSSI